MVACAETIECSAFNTKLLARIVTKAMSRISYNLAALDDL